LPYAASQSKRRDIPRPWSATKNADCGRAGERFDFAEMIAYLETYQLARQYLPEYLEIIPQIPMTASGKIQKFQLGK
jgi:acyl-CoA synthetase (AMP-forming)/AMP-acid ligase II